MNMKHILIALGFTACASDIGPADSTLPQAGSESVGLVTQALAPDACVNGVDAGQKAYVLKQLGPGWSIGSPAANKYWFGTGPGGRTIEVVRRQPPYEGYVTRDVYPSQDKTWGATCRCVGLPPTGPYTSCTKFYPFTGGN